jgi:predicted nucleotide-binding protein (sugar kinase/HSP70/actin superfamily)
VETEANDFNCTVILRYVEAIQWNFPEMLNCGIGSKAIVVVEPMVSTKNFG